MTTLAERYPHPRDKHISFESSTHTYTVKGIAQRIRSVTTVIHAHFPRFNADVVLKKMKDKEVKYPGQSDQQIKDMWSKQGQEAARMGTKLHAHIETFYNECPPRPEDCKIDPSIEKEWTQVEKFHHEVVENEGLTPYRTEWSIYDDDHLLAGQIDMVFQRPDGTFALYDWKRIKELKRDNPWEKGKGACASLDHCNGVHYTLQLNLYRWMLQKHYGITVSEMNLILFHPDHDEFERVRVPEMDTSLLESIVKS